MTDNERKWCVNAQRFGGSFVKAFATACLAADENNFQVLWSALHALMEKYPRYVAEVFVTTEIK